MSATHFSFRHRGFRGRIGVARGDITPPIGIYARNWGAARHDVAETIHRQLTLSAMVVAKNDGRPELVLIEGDLSWWRGLDTWHDFRSQLLAAIGVPPQQLIFSLSHSHAAPPLMPAGPDLPGGTLLRQWFDSVLQTSIDVVEAATARAEPALLEWHHGICQLAQTRDLRDPASAPERYICGYDPSQAADTSLAVGRLTSDNGRTRAVLVNYACHPTTLAFDNRAISPDFVGAMRDTIEREIAGAFAIFLQGVSGELAPRYQYVGDTSVADRHGRHLGHAALATLADMEPPGTELAMTGVKESGAPLAIWTHRDHVPPTDFDAVTLPVSIPIKDWPTADELRRELASCADRTLQERLRRKLAVRCSLGDADHFDLPLSLWRTGDVIWIGSMAESYSVLQRELRARFPNHTLVCMNLVNGSIGYLPPEELYDRDIYQVWQTPFARGSLERVVEQASSAISQLVKE